MGTLFDGGGDGDADWWLFFRGNAGGGDMGCTLTLHSFELRFGDIRAGKLNVFVHCDKLRTIFLACLLIVRFGWRLLLTVFFLCFLFFFCFDEFQNVNFNCSESSLVIFKYFCDVGFLSFLIFCLFVGLEFQPKNYQ